jgi:PKD repeat protein
MFRKKHVLMFNLIPFAMKKLFTLLAFLFATSSLIGQELCKVKIVFSINKSLPPSYNFKTEPQIEGAKYIWSFGDKTNSDLATPTHTFKITGDYVVFVKITDAAGKICTGEIKAKFEGETVPNIPVTPALVSGRGIVKDQTALDGCGLMIALSNGTLINPVQIVPDFKLKVDQNLELVYEVLKGVETVCMKGVNAKIHKIAEILPPTVCKLPIKLVKNESVPVSYTFSTDAQAEGSKYYWYMGDGGTSELASPTYTYKISNSYVVRLKVVDKSGKTCSGELKATFDGISPLPPVILSGKGSVKNMDNPGCGLVIALANGQNLIPIEMVPKFELKAGQNVELTYELLKDKPTACNAGIAAKIHKITEIVPPVACKLPIRFVKNETTPASYTFSTDVQAEGSKYFWYMGDGGTSELASPTYTFKIANTYSVHLKVVDQSGKTCTGELKAAFEGMALPPSNSLCKFDLLVKPKAETSNTYLFSTVSQAEVKTWTWDFGDGNVSDLKNPEHSFEKPGLYSIKCTISTVAGCTETRSIKLTVMAPPLPNCSGAISMTLFDPTDNKCNGKAIVKLLNSNGSEIEGVKYLWNDGRTGSIADGLCPNKAYTVQAVIEGVCQKSYSFNFLSKPIWSASNQNGQSIFSVIEPVEGVEYTWDLGNGISLAGSEINFTYEEDGIYDVTLKAASGDNSSELAQQVLIANSSTSILNINQSEIQIYPNPVNETLKIRFIGPISEKITLEIMNIAGQRIFSRTIESGINEAEVNVKPFHSGLYLLRIMNGKNVSAEKKFIKAD